MDFRLHHTPQEQIQEEGNTIMWQLTFIRQKSNIIVIFRKGLDLDTDLHPWCHFNVK